VVAREIERVRQPQSGVVSPDGGEVLPFPNREEEQAKRVTAEATRLVGLSPGEWRLWLPRSAERLGVDPKVLAALVEAQIKNREQSAAKKLQKDRLEEQRAERLRKLERDQQRERHIGDAAKTKAEKEREKREEKEAERQKKEAERKTKQKAMAFGNILKLPVARHERELAKLAERLGEDMAALREEFEGCLGVGGGEASTEKTEPWPEPVDTAAVLQECSNKVSKYVVSKDHLLTTTALWVAHAWLYDHDVPTQSPILAATSAEPDSGKSTLVAVAGHATPSFSSNLVELTGPSLYRYVDAVKPTIAIDEADDLFVRKSDLKHIVNAGWTRGAKIPRQANVGGVSTTVYFDPFTPKAIALLGHNLPPTTRSRCIELRMLPKRADEQAEDFKYVDDPEFAVLRRKFARWAVDNAAAVKSAQPTTPSGFNDRAAMNWKVLLAIADLAGGPWPKRAREAAERLSRSGKRPSNGVRLLAAARDMFAETGKSEITPRIWSPSCARIRSTFGRRTIRAAGSPSAKSLCCSTPTKSTPFRCTRLSARTSAAKATSLGNSAMRSRGICRTIQSSNHPPNRQSES
jgi:hypothetical protein